MCVPTVATQFGGPHTAARSAHPLRLDCLAPWPKWLDWLIPKPVPAAPLPMPVDAQGASRLRSWSTEALKIAIRQVAKAPVGTRNHTLNAMTYMLGEYIQAGGLDVAEVVGSMTIAARAAGEDERKITPDDPIGAISQRSFVVTTSDDDETLPRAPRRTLGFDPATVVRKAKQRPTIIVDPGAIDEVVTAAEQALIAAKALIYQQGTMLVRPVMMKVNASRGTRHAGTGIEGVRPRQPG